MAMELMFRCYSLKSKYGGLRREYLIEFVKLEQDAIIVWNVCFRFEDLGVFKILKFKDSCSHIFPLFCNTKTSISRFQNQLISYQKTMKEVNTEVFGLIP